MWKIALVTLGIAVVGAILWFGQAPAYHGPTGGSALCRDGTISYSHHSSGTCSWHGGVKAWNGTSLFDRILHQHPSLPND